jgi:hypothetical protein
MTQALYAHMNNKKIKIKKKSYNLTISIGVYPKEFKAVSLKDIICTPMFTTVLFTIAKVWRQNQPNG